jgi:peptidoglycan hydrolase-like protein with peptidoglycan-binding domain
MSGDDVKTLQDILKIEGVFTFPNSTGFFGGATRKAVVDLQNKYKNEILTPAGLTQGTGVVGKNTLAWLTANYK